MGTKEERGNGFIKRVVTMISFEKKKKKSSTLHESPDTGNGFDGKWFCISFCLPVLQVHFSVQSGKSTSRAPTHLPHYPGAS